jgi:hypothetical protein
MSDEWPGKWHSKSAEQSAGSERKPGITNDHGTLYMTDDSGNWLFYHSDGHDPLTEVRR